MEDPFTVLSTFLPDPPSKPLLTPLYPAASQSTSSPTSFPGPVSLAPDRPLCEVSPLMKKSLEDHTRALRKHWTVSRNIAGRRTRDKEDEDPPPNWKTPREPEAVDYGSFAILASKVVEDAQDCDADLSSASHLLDVLRSSLEADQPPAPAEPSMPNIERLEAGLPEETYWGGWGHQADDYLTDIVYGGIDGYAYIRSLAEFLQPPPDEDMVRHSVSVFHGYILNIFWHRWTKKKMRMSNPRIPITRVWACLLRNGWSKP